MQKHLPLHNPPAIIYDNSRLAHTQSDFRLSTANRPKSPGQLQQPTICSNWHFVLTASKQPNA